MLVFLDGNGIFHLVPFFWIPLDTMREHEKTARMIVPCVLCGSMVEVTYTVSTHALKHAPDQGVIASIACEAQLERVMRLAQELREHYINVHFSPSSWIPRSPRRVVYSAPGTAGMEDPLKR